MLSPLSKFKYLFAAPGPFRNAFFDGLWGVSSVGAPLGRFPCEEKVAALFTAIAPQRPMGWIG